MRFKTWLENTETTGKISQAIVQQFPASILSGGPEDVPQILQYPVHNIDAETKDKIRNLGMIRQLRNDAPDRYQTIMGMLQKPQRGQKVIDLVNAVSGGDTAVATPSMSPTAGTQQQTTPPNLPSNPMDVGKNMEIAV